MNLLNFFQKKRLGHVIYIKIIILLITFIGIKL